MKRTLLWVLLSILCVSPALTYGQSPNPTVRLTFEEFLGHDGAPLSTFYRGVTFVGSVTGSEWVARDATSRRYNVAAWDWLNDRDSGLSWSNGDYWICEYVGATTSLDYSGNDGLIRFDKADATFVQMRYTSGTQLILDAYNALNQKIATSTGTPNRRTTEGNRAGPGILRVEAPAGQLIDHVIVHDSGNYWVVDEVETDATVDIASDLKEFEWQRVTLSSGDSTAGDGAGGEYSVKILSRAVPPSPAAFPYPSVDSNADYEARGVKVLDAAGNRVDPARDPSLVRRVLANAHNAAVYRRWASDAQDPIPLLPLAGGFTEKELTDPYCWFFDLICLQGGTNTAFGHQFPGALVFPYEYLDSHGDARLVDWDVAHNALNIAMGSLYWHPAGLKNAGQRKRIYEELLEHLVLQDGIKELESRAAIQIFDMIQQNARAAELAGYGDTARFWADVALKVTKNSDVVEEAIRNVLPLIQIDKKTMAETSRLMRAGNNYTAWAAKAAPVVGFFLDAALTKTEQDLELRADLLMAVIQSIMLQEHGRDVLNALDEEVFAAGRLDLDPSFAEAFTSVKAEFSTATTGAFLEQLLQKLAASRTAGVVIDDIQLAISAAAAVAAVIPEDSLCRASWAPSTSGSASSGEPSTMRSPCTSTKNCSRRSWVSPRSTRSRYQSVLRASLEQLPTTGAVPESRLSAIGWLVSTRLYQTMFALDKVFDENSDWMAILWKLLGDSTLVERKKALLATKLRLEGVMFGAADPDPGMRFVAGRSLGGTQYLGFAPKARVDALMKLAGRTSVLESHSLVVRLGSPGEIGLVDPAGRAAGTFLVAQGDGAQFVQLNDVPGASDTGSASEPREIKVVGPLAGEYEVRLVGPARSLLSAGGEAS